MQQIKWIVFVWLVVMTSVQAVDLDCTQPLGKGKKFIRCGKATIQADIPIDERKSLSVRYPESKIISGDLDHDGINDFVVLATEHSGSELSDRVFILKGKSDGSYDAFAKSSTIEYGTANIEIKNNYLYLQIDHNSIDESHVEIFQFKLREVGIFLIGEEEISSVHVDERHGNESRTSTNYLTGDVIKTSKADGKSTSTIKEKTASKLLRLEDFSR